MRGEDIYKFAFKAREIIEKHHDELSTTLFSDFPRGACGNMSDMLGAYMSSKGIKDIEYVSGSRDQKTHGWIEIGEYLIDITSDQFSDGLGPVFVGKNRDFHDTFSDQRRSTPTVSACLIDGYNMFFKLMEEDL